jgi:hypothetical protein
MSLSRGAKIALSLVLALLLALAALWLARAGIAAGFAERYFRQHGVNSSVEIGMLGLSGASGRFALGPADAPELAAERIELFFDPLRWQPYLVEVRLVNPVVRARVDNQGRVTLPSLQAWLDSLGESQEKSPYVSDDLTIAFTGLRALLATPAGAVEINGDARIVRNRPVSLALSLKPGRFGWEGRQVELQKAALNLVEGGRMTVTIAGDYRDALAAVEGAALDLSMERLVIGTDGVITAGASRANIAAANFRSAAAVGSGFRAEITAPQLRFAGTVMETPRLTATIQARALQAQARLTDLSATLDARNLRASALDVVGEGDVTLSTTAVLPADLVRAIRAFPALAMEPSLAAAVGRNLGPLRISLKARALRRDGKLEARLIEPLLVRASGSGVLRVDALALSGTPPVVSGHMRASLSGGGLPPLRLNAQRFTWNGESLVADAALDGQVDFSALRGVRASLQGQAVYGDGAFRFSQARCLPISLAALGPLARDIKGQVCPAKAPLFAFGPQGWRLDAEARDAAAFLPLANADLSGGAAHLSFNGAGGFSGTVNVTAAKLSDKAAPLRFNPITGSGDIALAGGVWHGRFSARDGKLGSALGTATFQHAMATTQGSAHVEAPLIFAEGKLQPETLSPLLEPLRQSNGRADFQGDFTWGPGGLAGHTGTLTVRDFSFLTPMGRASGVDTTLNLTSLLPPATAPEQTLRIARVDWTLPLTALELRFGFSTTALRVEALQFNVADGRIALAPFSVNPSAPGSIASTATITSFSLAPLIAASNLSGKASLEGKLSGTVPFTAGSDGFRITKGRLTSDGPGRLSLNRSLWGDTPVTNVVQDFAFQALENLSFESLVADLNSIDQGRLSVLFHIKGQSDPPRPQVAEVAVQDIINGTALQKPIPLPSGTPIDLTLDTSLNFDELLKSYAEAWSKSLEGLGAGR